MFKNTEIIQKSDYTIAFWDGKSKEMRVLWTARTLIYNRFGLKAVRDFLQHENYDTAKVDLKMRETELNEKIIDAFDL